MNLNKIDISRSYIYVSGEDENWTAIKLSEVTGRYENIIFKYGKVGIEEDKDNGVASLQFEYDVLSSHNIEIEELDEDPEFKNLLGDILIHILEDQLSEDALQYVNKDN